MPLDEYYYSKQEGDPAYREEKGEYRFKVSACCVADDALFLLNTCSAFLPNDENVKHEMHTCLRACSYQFLFVFIFRMMKRVTVQRSPSFRI